MSKSLNRVELIGNVGRDPELKYTASGTPCTKFSMATSESWNDKDTGEKQTKTEWHNCIVWGKLAEIIAEHVKKGSKIRVEGPLRTREYVIEQGAEKGTKKKIVQVDVQDVMFLSSSNGTKDSKPQGGAEVTDDEIPF